MDDFRKLAADLTQAADNIGEYARKALQVTATNVKKDWQRGANRSGLRGYAADVTYDTRITRGGVVAEIGPTPGDPGSFGIVEDSPGDVKSAPQHAGRDAVEANEEDFIRGLERAIEDSLREVGL